MEKGKTMGVFQRINQELEDFRQSMHSAAGVRELADKPVQQMSLGEKQQYFFLLKDAYSKYEKIGAAGVMALPDKEKSMWAGLLRDFTALRKESEKLDLAVTKPVKTARAEQPAVAAKPGPYELKPYSATRDATSWRPMTYAERDQLASDAETMRIIVEWGTPYGTTKDFFKDPGFINGVFMAADWALTVQMVYTLCTDAPQTVVTRQGMRLVQKEAVEIAGQMEKKEAMAFMKTVMQTLKNKFVTGDIGGLAKLGPKEFAKAVMEDAKVAWQADKALLQAGKMKWAGNVLVKPVWNVGGKALFYSIYAEDALHAYGAIADKSATPQERDGALRKFRHDVLLFESIFPVAGKVVVKAAAPVFNASKKGFQAFQNAMVEKALRQTAKEIAENVSSLPAAERFGGALAQLTQFEKNAKILFPPQVKEGMAREIAEGVTGTEKLVRAGLPAADWSRWKIGYVGWQIAAGIVATGVVATAGLEGAGIVIATKRRAEYAPTGDYRENMDYLKVEEDAFFAQYETMRKQKPELFARDFEKLGPGEQQHVAEANSNLLEAFSRACERLKIYLDNNTIKDEKSLNNANVMLGEIGKRYGIVVNDRNFVKILEGRSADEIYSTFMSAEEGG